MLGIHAVGRDRGGYYLSDLASELPVSHPGRWAGRAADGLGLAGPARAEEFRRMLEGLHPRTGTVLGTGRTSVAAFDLTFSAPKSASVLFALAGTDTARTVVAAHEQAVAGSLRYLERHGITATRRVGPDRVVLPTSGALAAVFTHGVSRNGDPHLHSHVVVANLVHGVDGRWGACDRRGIDAHRLAASAVYEAHLRAELTATLGVRWTWGPGGSAEVMGAEPQLLAAFSGRSADIRRHMYEQGVRSGRGARVAWAATRPAKGSGASYRELTEGWRERARAVGGHIGLGAAPIHRGPAVLDEHRFAGVISLPAHGGAHRRDVVTAFAQAAPEGATAAVVEQLVAHWVPLGPPGVAEPLQQRRAVVPANHHLRALGPRPVAPGDHAVWLGAARRLDAYRERWGLTGARGLLGDTDRTVRPAAMPADRLADHVRTEHALAAARARLGWREPVTVERGMAR
ncbi:MAG: MobF family relaxase [Acidimicrobiales bacterium]